MTSCLVTAGGGNYLCTLDRATGRYSWTVDRAEALALDLRGALETAVVVEALIAAYYETKGVTKSVRLRIVPASGGEAIHRRGKQARGALARVVA